MVEMQTFTVPLADDHPESAQPGAIEPHDSMLTTLDVVAKAYDWCIGDDGRLYGLVSSDMGWAATHIVVSPEAIHDRMRKVQEIQ